MKSDSSINDEEDHLENKGQNKNTTYNNLRLRFHYLVGKKSGGVLEDNIKVLLSDYLFFKNREKRKPKFFTIVKKNILF